MIIVFPMAGYSRRFAEAGYIRPKFELPAGDYTVFQRSVLTFSNYFGTSDRFVFVYRAGSGTSEFIEGMCKEIGLAKSQIILIGLFEGTSGQGETVIRGLERLSIVDKDREPLVIFNIDTAYQEPVSFNIAELECADGLLDVFIGDGENWSFVEPFNENDQIGPALRVVEKERISSLCSTGMYWFKSLGTFQLAFDEYYDNGHSLLGGETYIAPIYQKMIERNRNSVIYRRVEREKLDFFGTPSEYEDYISKLSAVVGGLNA